MTADSTARRWTGGVGGAGGNSTFWKSAGQQSTGEINSGGDGGDGGDGSAPGVGGTGAGGAGGAGGIGGNTAGVIGQGTNGGNGGDGTGNVRPAAPAPPASTTPDRGHPQAGGKPRTPKGVRGFLFRNDASATCRLPMDSLELRHRARRPSKKTSVTRSAVSG